MARSKYKDEKKIHGELLDFLKKHFFEDEMEIKEDEMGMTRGKKYDADDSDMEYEGEDDMYESKSEHDDYYKEMMDESEEEDEEPKLSKDKRKHMAIILATKKSGRGKSK